MPTATSAATMAATSIMSAIEMIEAMGLALRKPMFLRNVAVK